MCLGKASGYRELKENKTEKVSLLKRKTNNDRINEMSVEEKAEFIEKITACCLNNDCEGCPLPCCSVQSAKEWLESEAKG